MRDLPWWIWLATAGLGYLLGSIPTAVWVSRARYGVDIRTQGSGNAGSTNVYRVLGFWPGMLVQVVDVLKGVLAAALPWLLSLLVLQRAQARTDDAFMLGLLQEIMRPVVFMLGLVGGLGAVVGHIFPLFAGFRGGKGMNTLLGMVLWLNPVVAGLAVAVFLLVLLISHYVSLASMIASAVWLLYVLGFYVVKGFVFPTLLWSVAVALPLLVAYTHRTNIARLRAGTESRVNLIQKLRGRQRG